MRSKYSLLLKRIRDTQVEEIDCSACLDQISQYVDLELAANQAADRLPQVKQHLDQCTVCFEEYQLLLQLGRLEQDGEVPSSAKLMDRLQGSAGAGE